MASEISLQAKLTAAFGGSTAANVTSSAVIDAFRAVASQKFTHDLTVCAASNAKTVVPTGTVAIDSATATHGYFVLLRNTAAAPPAATPATAGDDVEVFIENSAGSYATGKFLMRPGGFFAVNMQGGSGGYPRIVFAAASGTTNTQVVESIVCDG